MAGTEVELGGDRALAAALRTARVGDRLPDRIVGRRRPRRLEATAFVVRGSGPLSAYERRLEAMASELAAWDGLVRMIGPDGAAEHALVIVDRYGQVYETMTAPNGEGLPAPSAVEEWFRFLATACPECGVLDDPRSRAIVP